MPRKMLLKNILEPLDFKLFSGGGGQIPKTPMVKGA